ncbi:MAG: cytochrome c-type biogenesis protein CcmE [Myxococcota bacterium]|jgi:cytochrome c-type biogenesis protein CcmE
MTDTNDTTPKPARKGVSRKAPSRISRIGFPIFVVMLVLGGLALVVQSSTSGGVFDMTIGELQAQAAEYIGKDVRVNGVVQAGTFRENPSSDKIDIQFVIGDNEGNLMNVHYHQLLPDAFQEGRQVIVQGKLLSEGQIECDRLTVKCPSKYKDENMAGQKPPPGTPGAKSTTTDGY